LIGLNIVGLQRLENLSLWPRLNSIEEINLLRTESFSLLIDVYVVLILNISPSDILPMGYKSTGGIQISFLWVFMQ